MREKGQDDKRILVVVERVKLRAGGLTQPLANERKVAEEAHAEAKEEEEDDEGQGQVNPSVQVSE